jgi:flagellar hook-associated protein 2
MALINFSGIASGIDSASLIQSLLDRERSVRIKPLQTSIGELQDTNSAFGELSTLLSNLQTAAGRFRELNGGAISRQALSSDESVASASASNSAANGNYTVTVNSLAKNATFSFDDRFATTTTVLQAGINNGAPAADRTVSVTTGTGAEAETVSVELTNTSTAADYVASYNATATKSVAALVNVGTSASPSYAISISSLNEGTEEGQISDPTVGAELAGVFGAFSRDQATDANFNVSGISGSITRSSNSIADVISGVTLSLQDLGTATISVASDASETANTVQEFVDAFNEVVTFINENDLVTRQEDGGDVTNIFGPLAKTSVDNNVLTALRNALTSSGISGQTVNVLADLGVTTERDGTLKFDSSILETALSNDPDGVRQITQNLGETLASVDGTIAQFTRFNGLIDQTENSNSTQISSYQNKIAEIEKTLSTREAQLTQQYARLESLIGQLNSQQSTLSSLLGG